AGPGGAGRRGYDTGPGRRRYAAEPGHRRRGREPGPDRGRVGYDQPTGGERPEYGQPTGPPAEHSRRRVRIGWRGRGGRSGKDRAATRDERPDFDEHPDSGVRRGRLPGDDEALSPLPPPLPSP